VAFTRSDDPAVPPKRTTVDDVPVWRLISARIVASGCFPVERNARRQTIRALVGVRVQPDPPHRLAARESRQKLEPATARGPADQLEHRFSAAAPLDCASRPINRRLEPTSVRRPGALAGSAARSAARSALTVPEPANRHASIVIVAGSALPLRKNHLQLETDRSVRTFRPYFNAVQPRDSIYAASTSADNSVSARRLASPRSGDAALVECSFAETSCKAKIVARSDHMLGRGPGRTNAHRQDG